MLNNLAVTWFVGWSLFFMFSILYNTGNLPKIGRRKIGGIWFLKIGRMQFSYCLCKKSK